MSVESALGWWVENVRAKIVTRGPPQEPVVVSKVLVVQVVKAAVSVGQVVEDVVLGGTEISVGGVAVGARGVANLLWWVGKEFCGERLEILQQ